MENPSDPDDPYIHRKCVSNCDGISGYKTFLNRCLMDNKDQMDSEKILSKTGLVNFFQDVSEDLSNCWREVIYVCVISFIFSFIVLVMFRYVVGVIVWLVLLASVVASVIATIFLWIKYAEHKKTPDSERVNTYLVAALIATFTAIIVSLVVFVMRKRVKLVIELFKEAGKAISDMPMLLFEPLLVSLSQTFPLNYFLKEFILFYLRHLRLSLAQLHYGFISH